MDKFSWPLSGSGLATPASRRKNTKHLAIWLDKIIPK